jgi:[ribosomal protein S18]-alanine N-acetyltransferase
MISLPVSVSIEPMTRSDMEAVLQIDRRCSPTPWVVSAFYVELSNRKAAYFVARLGGAIVGYAGMQTIGGEAHFTTLAVDPPYRGRKIGERLLIALIEEAIWRQATHISLEVREGNRAAQSLYKKYGFARTATIKGYYTDTGENAVVMWASAIQQPKFREHLETLRNTLYTSQNATTE